MVLEAVNVVRASDVILNFSGDNKAFFVVDSDCEDWTYMQMPMVNYSKEEVEEKDDF